MDLSIELAASEFALELYARITVDSSDKAIDRGTNLIDPNVFLIDQCTHHGMPDEWRGFKFEEIQFLVGKNLTRALRGIHDVSPFLIHF